MTYNGQRPIAVLMTTYNGANWLDAQISSILSQRGVGTRIYVSDDGSTDNTESLLSELSAFDSRINWKSRKDKQRGAARNFYDLILSVDQTDNHYIDLSDQDDIWLDHKLSRAIEVLESGLASCYSASFYALYPNSRIKYVKKSSRLKKFDYLFESAGPGSTYVLNNRVFRKLQEFILKNRSLVMNIELHDWLIFAWARQAKEMWYIDERAALLYRQHSRNVFGANLGITSSLRRMTLVMNGWYRAQILLIARSIGEKRSRVIGSLERLSFSDRLYLMLNVRHFRRTLQDQIILVFLLMMM